MRSYSIGLAENPINDTSSKILMDLTGRFASWQHSTVDEGGNWEGDGMIDVTKTSPGWRRDFFMAALGKQLVVSSSGGSASWQGQIVHLELMEDGQTFTRSMVNMANWCKVIYTKPGPQLLQNGDVEGGAWGTVGTPSTIETTTDWWAKGTTSMHCVTDAGGEGMEIEDSSAGSSWSIVAGRKYICSVVINVVSGTWTLTVYQSDGTTVLAERSTSGTGREWLECQIAETNAYASTVIVHLTAANASEECYADGAMFQIAPVRAETKWHVDTDSVGTYGRMEYIELAGKKSDDEADNFALRELAERAWARSEPPRRGSTLTAGGGSGLTVSTKGLVWTLDWRYSLLDGAVQASTGIADLIDESEFISSSNGKIDSNTAEKFLESKNPKTLWHLIKEINQVGDGSGNVWMAGVYPGFVFRYEARPTGIQYKFQNRRMEYYGGGLVDPLAFRPGWCLMVDTPGVPTPAGAATIDDPRRVWLKKTWFMAEGDRTWADWERE